MATSTREDGPTVQGPFFRKVAKRKEQDRDAKIIITADNGETGVGKTALAVYLAKLLDTSTTGFNAEKQSTLDVPRFLELYDQVERGSALVLDEAEQIDSRRSMSNENVDASFKWQTRRVNQIVGILTLPSADVIDKRMEQLQDFWINVESRGQARVYEKRIHAIKKKTYYKTLQTIRWPNMDGDKDYEVLARKKDELINDEGSDDSYLRKSEVDERIAKAKKNAKREKRDEIIARLKEAGVEGKKIAYGVDLSPGRVSQITSEVGK